MADLLRLSRPWLVPSLRFRTHPPVLYGLRRSFSMTPPSRKRLSKREAAEASQTQIMPTFTLLLPKAFVTPPLWRFPQDPIKFAHMIWLILKTRFDDLRGVLSLKAISMEKLRFSKPRFQYGKSALVPVAKALHIQMSEAIAAGDKETLRIICTQELYQALASAIDSRPKGIRPKWELVRYEKSWRYPRLADWKIGYQPHGRDTSITKQAIVSIASVQRIARYDNSKGGAMIEGSERVRHMVEHIVLQSIVNATTFEAGPWRIWGTLPESTYESILQGIQDFNDLVEEINQRHKSGA